MKKIITTLIMSLLIVGSLFTQTFACGAILGEDEVPESLR